MQHSIWITLFDVIKVSFKYNSHNAEPIKTILMSQLVRKNYIYSKYSMEFPEVLF